MMLRGILVALVVSLGSLLPAGSAIPEEAARALDQVSRDALRTYVQTLASDDFKGRGVGDEGNAKAERFIATTFNDEDVPPGAANGTYFQDVDLVQPQLGDDAAFSVTSGAGTTMREFLLGDDFLPLPVSGDHAVTAPLVDCGFGITSAKAGYDDYSSVNVRGKVALVHAGMPERVRASDALSEYERSDIASPEGKANTAWKHGAAAVVVLTDGMLAREGMWPAHPSTRRAEFRLASDLRAHPGPVVVLTIASADPVVRALAGNEIRVASITPGITERAVLVHNVLGFIEGGDAKKRSNMVVVGAHLDHDGVDTDGQIYHGADDNASGTAAVMAAAGAFARAAAHGVRPSTSVLFALWNGEEKGELGAERFVEAPEPARHVVANINLDMVGRHEEVADPNDWRFRGLSRSDPAATGNTLHLLGYSLAGDLAQTILQANTAVGLTVLEDYDSGAQNLLQRSDNWPFLSHGIPAVFLTTGLHPDYHMPSDQAERIDYGKLERVTRLAARAAWLAADGPPPHVKFHP